MKPKPQGKTKKMWAVRWPKLTGVWNMAGVIFARRSDAKRYLDSSVGDYLLIVAEVPVRKGRKVTNP